MNRRKYLWLLPIGVVLIAGFLILRSCRTADQQAEIQTENQQPSESDGSQFEYLDGLATTAAVQDMTARPESVTYEFATATPEFRKAADKDLENCQQTFGVSYPIGFSVGDIIKAELVAENCTSNQAYETRIYILADQGPEVIVGPVPGFSAEIEFSAPASNFQVCGITSLEGDAQWQQGHAQCSPVPSQ